MSETEAVIAQKTFTTADASGAVGRMFHVVVIRLDDPAGRVIGIVGINALVPAPFVGYGIHPEFWGKGYARCSLQSQTRSGSLREIRVN